MTEEPIFLEIAELTPEEQQFRKDLKELNEIIGNMNKQMFLAYGILEKKVETNPREKYMGETEEMRDKRISLHGPIPISEIKD